MPRLTTLTILFGATLALFSFERLALWVSLPSRFAKLHRGELGRAFLVGMRFDVSIASLLTLLFLLVLLLTPLHWRPARSLAAALGAALLSLVALTVISDLFFFRQFSTHLDAKVLHYVAYRPTWSLLFTDTPWPWALLACAILFRFLWRRLRHGLLHCDPRRSRPLLARLGLLFAIPPLALGVRGNAGPMRMSSAVAYAGSSLPAAELALNGAYTLIQAGMEQLANARLERLATLPGSDAESMARVGASLAARSAGATPDAPHPLWHRSSSTRARHDANVVLIILESFDGRYPGCMGGNGRISQRFDALAARGLLMDQCYAVGSRTSYGLGGVLASFPELAAQSIVSRTTSEGHVVTLASILQQRGYRTLFLHPGQPSFDNKRGFMASNGFSETVFEGDFPPGALRSDYGWCDEDLYAETLRRLSTDDTRPFLAVLMTISFHRPYEIPDERVQPVRAMDGSIDAHLTSGRYADQALGRFIDQARKQAWFDDTVFVVVADHTDDQRGKVISPEAYRVPFLIYAPGWAGHDPDLPPGRRCSTVCSQIDVAPTVLDLLGGSYDSPFFGTSMLHRPAEDGWAVMLRGDTAMAFVDARRHCTVQPFRGGLSYLLELSAPMRAEPLHDDSLRDDLARRGLGVLQAADAMYWHDVRATPRVPRAPPTQAVAAPIPNHARD